MRRNASRRGCSLKIEMHKYKNGSKCVDKGLFIENRDTNVSKNVSKCVDKDFLSLKNRDTNV